MCGCVVDKAEEPPQKNATRTIRKHFVHLDLSSACLVIPLALPRRIRNRNAFLSWAVKAENPLKLLSARNGFWQDNPSKCGPMRGRASLLRCGGIQASVCHDWESWSAEVSSEFLRFAMNAPLDSLSCIGF